MRTSALRSWLFVHPDLDRSRVEESGLVLAPDGGIATATGDAAVRQGLLLLLSTSPGERIMRPAYGCDLRKLVFSPNDYTTAGLARHYVRRAVERWEPRVRILSIDAGPDPQVAERLSISLNYEVLASRRSAQLAFVLNLSGDAI
ncbi:MAG: GPW/gp25 family protein [Verrucomicrobium sp.]